MNFEESNQIKSVLQKILGIAIYIEDRYHEKRQIQVLEEAQITLKNLIHLLESNQPADIHEIFSMKRIDEIFFWYKLIPHEDFQIEILKLLRNFHNPLMIPKWLDVFHDYEPDFAREIAQDVLDSYSDEDRIFPFALEIRLILQYYLADDEDEDDKSLGSDILARPITDFWDPITLYDQQSSFLIFGNLNLRHLREISEYLELDTEDHEETELYMDFEDPHLNIGYTRGEIPSRYEYVQRELVRMGIRISSILQLPSMDLNTIIQKFIETNNQTYHNLLLSLGWKSRKILENYLSQWNQSHQPKILQEIIEEIQEQYKVQLKSGFSLEL